MTEADQLKEIRARIDALDDQILTLISERAQAALEVARIKRAAGETGDFYRPEREAAILRRLAEQNPGPLGNDQVACLFREIMSACLAIQSPLKVAFLGPVGTFTEAAAIKHFGHAMQMAAQATIDSVFGEVESGAADYGVVPVENSTEGVVSHTLDRFMTSPLQIIGEVELPIHQNLLGQTSDFDRILRVYSHQQGLAQCRQWLDENLPRAERIAVSSTAEAARLASQDAEAAAVASQVAGEKYGLRLLNANIEDGAANTTRFLIIGRQSPPSTGEDKTSLVVSRSNQPGGLFGLLEPLAKYGVNMSRIESRPSRQGMWEYVFFLDVLGHADDESVRKALEELQQRASLLKILGSYPRAAR